MKAIIFDTETTGTEEDSEIIEVAWREVEFDLSALQLRPVAARAEYARFRPSKPISYGAMATHHITPNDLRFCAPSSEFTFPAGVEYLIGHKIDFDWQAAGKPDVKRICTLALSRYTWPDLDSHKQAAVGYYLALERGYEWLLPYIREAHSAEKDTMVCLHIARVIADVNGITSFEDLYELSEKARVPTHMTFGKHYGLPIKDLPCDYKAWLLGLPDLDPYLAIALKK